MFVHFRVLTFRFVYKFNFRVGGEVSVVRIHFLSVSSLDNMFDKKCHSALIL